MRTKDFLERVHQALAATQKSSQTLEVPRAPVGFVGKELARSNACLLAEIEELEICLRREAEAKESFIEAARIGHAWNSRRALLKAELHRVRADATRALDQCEGDNQEKLMTTPDERTRSLLQAAAFLKELASDSSLPPAIRQGASRLLRHYPTASTVHLLATMEAKHFGSNLLSAEVAELDVMHPHAH